MKRLKTVLAKLEEASRNANKCLAASGSICVICIAEITLWHAEFQRLLLNGVRCSEGVKK